MTQANTGSMKAARYSGPQSLIVEERAMPAPGTGEALLRVTTCGICGTDLHFYSGRWPQPEFTPGHEIVGHVLEAGADVQGWHPGDRVVVEPIVFCGHCRFCLRGETNRCQNFKFISTTRDGGFANAVTVPAKCLHHLPDNIPDPVAALIEPLAVGVHAVRVGQVSPGAVVAVCGAGAIGLMTAVAALDAGAARVLSSARHPHQQEAAIALGAEAVSPDGLEDAVQAATGGAGADIVFETVGGAGQAVGQALSAVRSGGVVVLVGGFTRPTSVHLARVVNREIQLRGSNCYSRDHSPTDFERSIEIAASGSRPLDRLVTHHAPLSEISRAFQTALDKSTGAIKVQVKC
jgi:2-desacetyl-2-hydroxyethyl bacteriochlorophyllide A dehydrogenase